MKMGSSYYPERWDKNEWANDAALMKDAGFTFIRTGEFAWSRFEPREGKFDFTWMDEAIDLLNSYGVKILMCTPTASPPPWLTSKYPEVLPVTQDGKPFVPGQRRHYCYNSSFYRDYSAKIVTAMAKHYAGNENVVGWQIDNELGGEEFICCCDICEKAFREWLRKKYGTVEELNRCWGGKFFSLEFTCWNEINVPHGHMLKYFNPSFKKDYLLFYSDSMRDYLYLQVDCLKKHTSAKIPVTTNRYTLFWGDEWIDKFDHRMDKYLDVIAFDNYDKELSLAAFHHDFYRSIKPEASYWVLEQGCGTCLITDDPREFLLQTVQAAARGTDLLCYFMWRQINYGAEQDLYGMVLHNGKPGESFELIKSARKWLDGEGSVIMKMERRNEFAVVYSFESSLTMFTNNLLRHVDYSREMYKTFYTPAFELGIGTDYLFNFENLSGYKLVLIPMHIIESADAVEKLEDYIKAGGCAAITGDFMLKSKENHRVYGENIDRLNKLLGISHQKLLFIMNNQTSIVRAGEDEYEMHGYYNKFSVCSGEGVTVLARVVSPDVHADSPALIERKIGAGRLVFFAGLPSKEWMKAELRRLAADIGLETFDLPEKTELIKLYSKEDDSAAYMIINKRDETLLLEPSGIKVEVSPMSFEFVSK